MTLDWRSVLLLIGATHGLVVAILLLRQVKNRVANRFLAALLINFVLIVMPTSPLQLG